MYIYYVPARFLPGFGLCLSPGLASHSKPREEGGGSAKAGLGTWSRHWPICWWFASSQLSKAGGRGREGVFY